MTVAPLPPRLGLGVGLDLPWRGPYGVVGERVADRTVRFLRRYADRFAYLFVSWQPPDHGVPRLADVVGPWDTLFAEVPIRHRALHQTALNLAGTGYDRGPVVALTNQLAERYGFVWINEDLGHWSVRGRPLPYPQPPALTASGIAACARACADVDRALDVPLVVEFPGFETPAPWLEGDLDAYDVFREVVERADVLCNLDTGHLLTWRWLRGHRGEDLLDGLDRLPLDRCVEIHCAGTHQSSDALVDAHHGVLSDVQLALTEALIARCPALRVVTWEDPRFDARGALPPRLDASLAALEARVAPWARRPADPPQTSGAPRPDPGPAEGDPADAGQTSLAAAWAAPTPFGRRCRAQILRRTARGVGRIAELYPIAIAAWRAAHGAAGAEPDTDPDADLDALTSAFLRANDGEGWSDVAWAVPGRCLEDAFGRFVAPSSAEHLTACARALAVHPAPPFVVPDGFRRAPRGWFAVAGRPPVLYAAVDGRLVTGSVTDAIVDVLRGSLDPARRRGDPVVARLVAMGLV